MKIIYPPPTAVAGGLAAANNLSDIASAAAARANLSVLSKDEVQIQKQLRALVISDGATPNRAQVQTGTTRTALASAPAATWRGLVYVPTSNPSTAGWIFFRGSTSTIASGTAPNNSLHCLIPTLGELRIRAVGSSSSNLRTFEWSGFRAAYSGQWIILEVYFVNGSTDPVVRVNGSDISSSFTATPAGTPPDWLDSSLTDTYILTGYTWPSGPAPLGCWINGALSDADRTYWRETGLPPKWVVDGGSMVELYTRANASSLAYEANDSTTGVSKQGTWTVTSEAGAATGSSGSYYLKAVKSGAEFAQIRLPLSGTSITLQKKGFIRAKVRASGTFSSGLVVMAQNDFSTITASQAITADGTWQTVTLQFTSGDFSSGTDTTSQIGFGVASGTVGDGAIIEIDDLSLFYSGALSLPVQGPEGYVLDGTRQTPSNIGTLTGMAWNNPLPVGSTIAVNKYFAHDDISATAATTTFMTLPAGWAIESYHRGIAGGAFFDAGVTISVGYTSSATEFISADAVDATYNKGVASSRVGPLSLAAGLAYAIYLKKSGATTVGAAYITLVLKRIF